MKQSISILLLFSFPFILTAQDNLTVKDAAEIGYKSELLINEFRDLLNIISNTETNLKETKDLIYNSHSGARNKIFSNSTITVEDDLNPLENKLPKHREISIEKYLNDIDLLYQKSDSASIQFTNIRASDVKKADYLYVKVYYSSLFRNRAAGSDPSYVNNNRVAEIRIDKEKNKWLLQITRVAFFNPADTIGDIRNDVALTYPSTDAGAPGSSAQVTSGDNQSFAEELRTQERARQVAAFTKEKGLYNKLIESGDQSLLTGDNAAALKAFTEAGELSPYEIYPKLKINQIRKTVDQASVSDDEVYRQYLLKGQIAEKERKYEEAKDDYNVALAKKPMQAASLSETVRSLTAKLRTSTELEEKYNAGQFKDAIKDYDKAIKKDNRNSDFFLGRGKCYDKLGDYNRTMKDYSTAIDLDNNNLQAWKLRAMLYTTKGDYVKALSDYKICTTINKTDTGVYFKMSDLHVLTGNLRSAEEDLNKVIDLDPKIATTYYKKGMLLNKEQEMVNAMKNFSIAIKADPAYGAAYYQRGLCNIKLRNNAQAGEDFVNARKSGLDDAAQKNVSVIAAQFYSTGVDQFNKHVFDSSLHLISAAILIDPNVAEYHFKRGECYFLTKEYESASLNYSEAIRLKENYYDAYNRRGWSKMNQFSYESAVPDFLSAIKLNPQIPATYKMLGDAYFMLQKYGQAISQYQMALQTAKANKIALDETLVTELYNREGKSYFNTGDNNRALDIFKTALKSGKNNAEAYFNRGNTYLKLNELKDAQEDISKALSIQPNEPSWCFALAKVYQQQGQFENAAKEFSRAISLDSSKQMASQAIHERGHVYYQMGDYLRALPDYISGSSQSAEGKSSIVNLEFANIYLQLGRSDSARARYLEVLALDSMNVAACYGMGCVFVQKNQFDLALPYFEKAFRSGTLKYAGFKKDRQIAAIKDDKRFKALIKKYF